MRRHINVYVEENFPSVSKLDASFYPSDQCLSSIMYRAMILHRHFHLDQEKVLTLVTCFKYLIPRPRYTVIKLIACNKLNHSGRRLVRTKTGGLFFFRPATQEKEITDKHNVTVENLDVDKDNILYSCGHDVGETEPCSLLFIHQNYDQLQILKR